jgi:hypothetical protein
MALKNKSRFPAMNRKRQSEVLCELARQLADYHQKMPEEVLLASPAWAGFTPSHELLTEVDHKIPLPGADRW